jgi:hypothetical protein
VHTHLTRLVEAREDLLRQALDLLGQPAVGLEQLRLTMRDVFAVPCVGLGAGLVAVGLPRLREQDQRRGVGGLGREREVQQDERVRVPAQRDRGRVDRDPRDDEDGLPEDVVRRPEETGEPLGACAESSGAERSLQVLVAAEMAERIGDRPTLRTRPDGSGGRAFRRA